ncbi:MAG: ribonuclease D [Xanthomonadales bacterium]|nr:ribonuclease D [Xanthomonadales bacterium]
MNMDATHWKWISNQDDFAALCTHLHSVPVIGIDTEFIRTRTFYARLGLLQLSDHTDTWLVDPLQISDWACLGSLLQAEQPVKIIHSGSEDMEILHRIAPVAMAGFFDTQIAAALCGIGPALSYQALVGEVLGVAIDKGETRSNWLQRPLSESQMKYAALDVSYLPELHQKLSSELQNKGRQAWCLEDSARMARPISEQNAVAQQYDRFKMVWRLKPDQRAGLMAALTWREATARRKDIPRNRIMDNDGILAIARTLPGDLDALQSLNVMSRRFLQKDGPVILEGLQQALASEDRPPKKPPPLDRDAKPLMERLRGRVRQRAEDLGLAPETLAGKREITALISGGSLPEKLQGWRRAVVGQSLLDDLNGDAMGQPAS